MNFLGRRGKALLAVVGLALLVFVAACGQGSLQDPLTGSGLVTLRISDPPTCKGPGAPGELNFDSVWVTVTLVRAHISSGADPDAGGWVDLADLTENPLQLDLLDGFTTQCTLATLGTANGLPPGNYQQIRLHLLSNIPGAGEATPTVNECDAAGGFNCVVVSGTGELKLLELSSQANNGIKIPPGQIAGGGIQLETGQSADINIEFNACHSVVRQGMDRYRLLPTLHAGEVSVGDEIIGRVVDMSTGNPLAADATIIVMAEQPDMADPTIDRMVMETMADPSTGVFSLCPLPDGDYDIVAAGIDGSDVTYNATVTFAVPSGTDMGDIPLVPETGANTSPATIQGDVTTTDPDSAATGADIALSALQRATPDGGSEVALTIPQFGASTGTVNTEANGCPTGTKCASYTLIVPASNPKVGTFDVAGTTYADPAAPPVPYEVNARAFKPDGTTEPNCNPSSLLSDPVDVTAGTTVAASDLTFTECEAGN